MNQESNAISWPFFFIVGRGRSGTTLLRVLLDTHPQISVAPEAQFIINLYGKYARTKWDKEKIHAFYDDLWLEERLHRWNLNKERLKQDLLACGDQASFSDLCMIVYANYASIQGKKDCVIWGDKNPNYALFLEELVSLFPEAKFIHLVRDYRDCILSYQSVRFDLDNICALAYRWKKYNEVVLEYSTRYSDKFILLRYEDLVTDSTFHLKRICTFLGVDFDPVMLEFYKHQTYERESEWHKNLAKPLDQSRLYLWKREMKENDVLRADYICGNLASHFGYEDVSRPRAITLFVRTLPGILCGWIFTFLERIAFLLPIKLQTGIITLYRIVTGSHDM